MGLVGFDVDVKVPLPVPVLLALRVTLCGVNVAVTERAAFIVTVQVAPETVSHPVHPASVEPLSACAVSDTTVPLLYVAEQFVPQLISEEPGGFDAEVTVPVPAPALATVSEKFC